MHVMIGKSKDKIMNSKHLRFYNLKSKHRILKQIILVFQWMHKVIDGWMC